MDDTQVCAGGVGGADLCQNPLPSCSPRG